MMKVQTHIIVKQYQLFKMENIISKIDSSDNFLNLILEYKGVIENFKKLPGTLNGKGIGYKRNGEVNFEDRPKGIGDGLATTGWCVSASDSLLHYPLFQTLLAHRKAKAKLVSIDIKEQYHGYVYNGHQNKWHTAILVEDFIDNNKMTFIIDITCRQFGDNFIDKDFWTLKAWLETLRSNKCCHKVCDFDNNEYSIAPVLETENYYKINDNFAIVNMVDNLRDLVNLSEADRLKIADFLVTRFDYVNTNLILGKLQPTEITNLNELEKLFNTLYSSFNASVMYGVLPFKSKPALINFIELLIAERECKLPIYMRLFEKVKYACDYQGMDIDEINKVYDTNPELVPHYLIFEFEPNSINMVNLPSDKMLGVLRFNETLKILKDNVKNTAYDKIADTKVLNPDGSFIDGSEYMETVKTMKLTNTIKIIVSKQF